MRHRDRERKQESEFRDHSRSCLTILSFAARTCGRGVSVAQNVHHARVGMSDGLGLAGQLSAFRACGVPCKDVPAVGTQASTSTKHATEAERCEDQQPPDGRPYEHVCQKSRPNGTDRKHESEEPLPLWGGMSADLPSAFDSAFDDSLDSNHIAESCKRPSSSRFDGEQQLVGLWRVGNVRPRSDVRGICLPSRCNERTVSDGIAGREKAALGRRHDHGFAEHCRREDRLAPKRLLARNGPHRRVVPSVGV